MSTALDATGRANYGLSRVHILEQQGKVEINSWVGKSISLRFTGDIHCIATGKKIKKTYGEGLSYDAFLSSPLNSPSIVHPELSRIHEGIALRDFAWEQEHHNRPHYVYLSLTSHVKVGVTRDTNLFSRWIDQGATEGIRLAYAPYRQLAGAIEVALKEHFSDKTAWQAMLKGQCAHGSSLSEEKDRALQLLPEEFHGFIDEDDTVVGIEYPIVQLPAKPTSLKAETTPEFSGKLLGIKGQYWLLDGDRVFNVRSHAGYQVDVQVE